MREREIGIRAQKSLRVRVVSYRDNRHESRAKARLKSFALFMFIFMVVQIVTVALPQVFGGRAFAAGSTYYVDATGGNDSNNGTTTGTAWKTIAKVNGRSFNPGDSILFKRSEMWRERLNVTSSGSAGSYITFGAYGSGNKPEIVGSISWDDPAGWNDRGSNIWETDVLDIQSDWYVSEGFKDVANIMMGLGGATLSGLKKLNHSDAVLVSTSDLTVERDYYYDRASSTLKMYSTQNPASMYDSIELVESTYGVSFRNQDYLRFDNLSVKNFGILGFNGGTNNHIYITNCDVSWIGGSIMHNADDGYGNNDRIRFGNGIQFWLSAEDIHVENNHLWEIYDAALTSQGQGVENTHMQDQYYRNNLVEKSEYGIEFWQRYNYDPNDSRNAAVTADNIVFENNTIVDSGVDWGHNQRPNAGGGVNGRAFLFYTTLGTLSDISVRNNILYGSTESNLRIVNTDRFSAFDIDNNNYDEDSSLAWIAQGNVTYPASNFAGWKTDIGKDSSSRVADASFVNAANDNYLLSYNSPDIDSGATGTSRTTDLLGNPIYGTPDIGAYEYQPPYTLGTNNVDVSGGRIYEDGKFRDLGAVTGSKTDLRVTPSGGSFASFTGAQARPQWLDITGITWLNTGDYHKQWTESSTKVGLTNTAHTVGDLVANKYYSVSVGGAKLGSYKTNSQGKLTFTYAGNYSAPRTFTVDETTYSITQPNEYYYDSGVGIKFVDSLPSGATGIDITVSAASSTSKALPSGKQLTGLFDISAINQDSVEVATGFTAHIVLDYPAADDTDEAKYTVLYWDGTNWSSQGISSTSVDTAANQISFDTTHFSEYAVFADSQSGVSSAIAGAVRTLPITGSSTLPFVINLFITACVYVFFRKLQFVRLKKS